MYLHDFGRCDLITYTTGKHVYLIYVVDGLMILDLKIRLTNGISILYCIPLGPGVFT